MVKANLRYTYLAKGRYWRFRHSKTGDVQLPGSPGDDAFHEKYAALLALVTLSPVERDRASFAWLVARYRAGVEFHALADATQLDYDRTLDLIVSELGDQPFAFTTRVMISWFATGMRPRRAKRTRSSRW